MQIRRNTKSFKTILEIVTSCQSRTDRQNLIRLYTTKIGHSIKERVSVEGVQAEAVFFYDLNYQNVLNNLKSPGHQLHLSDEVPGLYYFQGVLNKAWDETPFEFDARVTKEFAHLPELPASREKGKSKEFVFPEPTKEKQEPVKKGKPIVKKVTMTVSRGPQQPNYDLKHELQFTDLDRVTFRNAQLSKKDVLDHYNQIADYLLPYLKDRPHLVRKQSESGPNPTYTNLTTLPKKGDQEIPGWVQTAPAFGSDSEMFACRDKEHLLFYVELGCVEFDPCHSRTKSPALPDYAIIGIDSTSGFKKIAVVVNAMREVLDGLRLPGYAKTDGISGLHIYIPLDSKCGFDASRGLSEYICKLTRLKMPDVVALKGSPDNDYGKVVLDPLLNQQGIGIVAPYSFAAGGSAAIATPVLWEEVNENLRIEEFNHKTIFERLKKVGDPFESLFRKKINADEQLERMESDYSFLF